MHKKIFFLFFLLIITNDFVFSNNLNIYVFSENEIIFKKGNHKIIPSNLEKIYPTVSHVTVEYTGNNKELAKKLRDKYSKLVSINQANKRIVVMSSVYKHIPIEKTGVKVVILKPIQTSDNTTIKEVLAKTNRIKNSKNSQIINHKNKTSRELRKENRE
jgi:hypothetical protein